MAPTRSIPLWPCSLQCQLSKGKTDFACVMDIMSLLLFLFRCYLEFVKKSELNLNDIRVDSTVCERLGHISLYQ